jgi:hypothetical protein
MPAGRFPQRRVPLGKQEADRSGDNRQDEQASPPSTLISDLLIPKLQERFPGRGLKIGTPPAPCATFPAVHPEVGDLVIHEHGGDLIAMLGKCTHCHFANYEPDLTQEEKAKRIVAEVIAFLEAVFMDRVIMWGSHEGGGGFYQVATAEEIEARSPRMWRTVYLWSGPRPPAKDRPAHESPPFGRPKPKSSGAAYRCDCGKMRPLAAKKCPHCGTA